MPYPSIAFIIVFAVLFYRAAELEDAPGGLWPVLSVAISLVTLSRTPKLKWPGCGKMLEQKPFGKIADIPAVVG